MSEGVRDISAGGRAFDLISRLAVATYGRFPIFGSLRSSVAVVRRGDTVLMLQRNDGHGLGFPGGIAWPWESDDKAARRELEEETGLVAGVTRFLFRYRDHTFLPVVVSVYATEATGELHSSWEGDPLWVPVRELEKGMFPSHAPIRDKLVAGVLETG